MNSYITQKFRETILGVYRENGEVWLQNLPNLLETFSVRWGLVLGEPFPLSYNFVVSATTESGESVVLKAGVPDRESWMEIDALRYYEGHGMARILNYDYDECVILLERVKPGTTLLSELNESNDDWATEIAAGLMKKLWRPLPADHGIRTLESWTEGILNIVPHYSKGIGPLSENLVARAVSVRSELLASAEDIFLLHGDLHHENILRATREPWLAIDPKGIAGDRAFDVCSFLMNPAPESIVLSRQKTRLERRIEILSDILEIDRQRLKAWFEVYSVLSAWWGIEDSIDS